MATKSTNSVLGTVHTHALALRSHCQQAYDAESPIDASKVKGHCHAILAALEAPAMAKDSKAKGTPVHMGF